jgi:hypothetical protein
MTSILGQSDSTVYHATIPFYLGGSADVLRFPHYVPGMTYATCELTGEDVGQISNSLGHYELMICVREDLDRAAQLVSQLSRYTCEAKLEPGETMDLSDYFGDSTIRALLFAQPDLGSCGFELAGERCGLLLCLGITQDELEFRHSEGVEKLLELLKKHGVFPYTEPSRPSVLSD